MDSRPTLSLFELTSPRDTKTNRIFQDCDPATQEAIPEGSVARAPVEFDAADRAFDSWAATSPRDRREIHCTVDRLAVDRTRLLTTLICAENGKSQGDARAEVICAAIATRVGTFDGGILKC